MRYSIPKRLVAASLSFLLLLLSSPFVMAESMPAKPAQEVEQQEPEEGALTKEEAIKIAQSLIPLPQDYKLESSYYNSSSPWEPSGSWRLQYAKKEGKEWQGSIDYTLNAKSGELMYYSTWGQNDKEPTFPPKVSKEEAMKKATEFIAKISPEKAKQTRIESPMTEELPILDSRQNYFFNFVRTHNGITFPNNGLFVEVTTDGEVRSFSSNWNDNVVFPKEELTVSYQEAIDKLKSVGKDQLMLQYVNPWNSLKDEMFISYQWNQFNNGVTFIDAITGKSLNGQLKEVEGKVEYDFVSKTKLEPYFKNRKAELTEKEALEHLWKVTGLKEAEFKLEHGSYHSDEAGRNVWNFSFVPVKNDSGEYRRLYVGIDANSGQFTNYSFEDSSYYMSKIEEVKGLSHEELLQKAKEAYKKFSPDNAHEMVYLNSGSSEVPYYESNRIAHFSFHRVVNDIFDTTYNSSITMDRVTGDIIYFYQYSPQNKTYPTTDGLISKEAALEKIFEQYQVVLQYQIYQEYPELKMEKQEAQNLNVRLVYQIRPPAMNEPVFLNAKSGQWHLYSNGEEINLNRVSPTDIEKHWAKEPLMLMYQYRAIDTDENGKLKPNAKIKRGEMVKMLILSLHQGRFHGYYGLERSASFNDVGHKSPYFQYVEAAVDMNLIDRKASKNFNPEDTLTREEMAVMIVRALGYNKIAKLDDLFNLDVKDYSSITNKGHVAIVTHLGIMTAQNEHFQPKREVTRAEAATAFYRFLQKRVEVTETHTYLPYY